MVTPCLWNGNVGSPRHTSLGWPSAMKNKWIRMGWQNSVYLVDIKFASKEMFHLNHYRTQCFYEYASQLTLVSRRFYHDEFGEVKTRKVM